MNSKISRINAATVVRAMPTLPKPLPPLPPRDPSVNAEDEGCGEVGTGAGTDVGLLERTSAETAETLVTVGMAAKSKLRNAGEFKRAATAVPKTWGDAKGVVESETTMRKLTVHSNVERRDRRWLVRFTAIT